MTKDFQRRRFSAAPNLFCCPWAEIFLPVRCKSSALRCKIAADWKKNFCLGAEDSVPKQFYGKALRTAKNELSTPENGA